MIFNKIFGAHSSLPKEQDPFFWFPRLGGRKSAAGQVVTEDKANQLSAYYACVRNLSEDIAALPICTFKDLPNGGREPDTENDVAVLLRGKPNPATSSYTFRSSLQALSASWGNGYAEIVRDQRGRPKQLWLIHPSRVTYEVVGLDLVYTVHTEGTEDVEIKAANMIHLKGMSLNGFEGISVLNAAAEVIGVSLAEQEFTASFLNNGASLSGVLQHPKTLGSDAYERLRESWGTAFKGSSNAGKPAILEQGMEWKPLSIPQRDAQFLEQREFSINEICRWFRMPPHKIQHLVDATYSNIESQDRQYVNDTLMSWLIRTEQEFTNKLFSQQQINSGMRVSHKVEGRLRGDTAARKDFYQGMVFSGLMTPNEVRQLENLNPMGPEGDVFFMQSAMTTIDAIISPPEPPAPVAPPEPDEKDEEKDEPEEKDDKKALAVFTQAASARVVRKTLKATEGKDRTPEWLGTFYKEQAGYLGQELRPVTTAFNGTFGAPPTVAMLHDTEALTDHLLNCWIPKS